MHGTCVKRVLFVACRSSRPSRRSLTARHLHGLRVPTISVRCRQTWLLLALPEVEILDASGRLFARQGADFTFRAADGSFLKATISAADTSGSNSRMKDVLFEVTARGNPIGVLSRFRYVKRTAAVGGIPPSPCRRNSLGTFLKVPFHATYAFYH